MIRKRLKSCFLAIASGVVISGCSLSESVPPPNLIPLTLQIEKNLSLTQLTWNPVKVTGFKEYIILHSSSDIPDSPTPVISSNVTVLKRIDDADITTFSSSEVFFSQEICYKIYASVEDRFIRSTNVCVQQDFHLIPGFYDRAGHEEGLDEMVMFDRVNRYLSAYNYKEGIITNQVNDIVLSFPVIEVSTHAGTTHVFAYDQSPGRLRKYTFPGLISNMYKDFSAIVFDVQPYEQFLFVAVEEWGKSFQVLNKSNLVVTDSEDGLLGNRNLAVFAGDPVIVLDINDNQIKRYSVNTNGQITYLETKSPGIFQPNTLNIAQGANLFIGGRNGEIVDRDGNIINSLENNINSVIVLTRLSSDEKKSAYIVSDNISIRLEIADISNLQDINHVISFNIPSANYSDLIIDDDIIYVTGVSFTSGEAQTFVLKYPMP